MIKHVKSALHLNYGASLTKRTGDDDSPDAFRGPSVTPAFITVKYQSHQFAGWKLKELGGEGDSTPVHSVLLNSKKKLQLKGKVKNAEKRSGAKPPKGGGADEYLNTGTSRSELSNITYLPISSHGPIQLHNSRTFKFLKSIQSSCFTIYRRLCNT